MSIPGTIPPQPDSPTRSVPHLSVVTSVYRSERFIPAFIDETIAAIQKAHIEHYEIIFVNDGSPDDSLGHLLRARTGNPSIKIVDLSRNFGHHKAIMAGLSYAKGELTLIIDCDLEVHPGVLQPFLDTLQDTGADVVYGIQEKRKGALVERTGGALFWYLFNRLSETKIPANVLSERLMTRRYVDALLSLGDRNVFLGGMMYWSGFRQIAVLVKKTQREGASTYSFRKRVALLLEAVTSFSTVPLKLVLGGGIALTLCAGVAGIALLIRKMFHPESVLVGFTSLMLVIIGMAGIIITVLGVIGLYISRIYTQTQNRPLFIVREFHD
ncbi:MAG: glycosyltransferase family 2 protein [Rhodanobacter sp.]